MLIRNTSEDDSQDSWAQQRELDVWASHGRCVMDSNIHPGAAPDLGSGIKLGVIVHHILMKLSVSTVSPGGTSCTPETDPHLNLAPAM